MSAHADRNLLFGILALQMDFIGRDALIAAMHAWVLDKAKPLGDILAAQGDLDADTHALLEALVRKHLAQHGDDPAASLAVVSSIGPLRDELRQVADPDVQASLAVVSRNRSADDPNATGPLQVGMSSSSGLRFRVLRPHAKGALGRVSVAMDEELHREVALKEIQDHHADHPESRARFLLEAEVTGGLEHPGVVPVYGLGTYDDGRPFYAMRFIKGDSLHDAIQRFHGLGEPGRVSARSEGSSSGRLRGPARRYESLAFRRLLGRFVDVCNAIAYAHSRGVLHRDLKPGNIMLGKYGETLVVDWGLAKPLGQAGGDGSATEGPLRPVAAGGSSATVVGSAVGTPAYMSPEQAEGRLDELGPASDVYSLGVTLYELLSGRRAFVGSGVEDVLARVRHGDFPPPRQVHPDVPQALEAVCLKAMAVRPADRYGTVLALAADVEHWLADEPVTAYREPLREQARRWVKRHRTLVTGLAATLVVGLLSLTVATVMLTAANERERSARANEEVARQDAETQRDVAQQQRDRASAARKRTREALDAMVSGVTGESLATQTALSAEQKKFLEDVLKYYEEFAAEPGEDHEGAERLAKAHARLGMIHYQLGQRQEGTAVFARAVELYRRLVADFPALPAYKQELARSHNNLGLLLADLGQRLDAESAHRAALALLERLAADVPGMPQYHQELAVSYNNLGLLLARLGKKTDAESAYRAALALQEKLVANYPAVPQYHRGLALSHNNLGVLLAGLGKKTDAESAYRAALALQEKLVSDFPTVPEYRQSLARSHNNLGNLLKNLGKLQESDAAHRAALDVRAKLAADFPKVPDYAVDLGGSYLNFGNLIRDQGELTGSLNWYGKAVTVLGPILRADQRHAIARRNLRYSHWGRAVAFIRLNRFAEALADWDQALALDDGSARTALRLGRADALARTGAATPALTAADELAETKGLNANQTYDLARVYALAAAKLPPDDAERAAASAVARLRQAVAQGYRNVAHLLQDGDLDPLRRRADYADLLWDLADTPARSEPAKPAS